MNTAMRALSCTLRYLITAEKKLRRRDTKKACDKNYVGVLQYQFLPKARAITATRLLVMFKIKTSTDIKLRSLGTR